jgi:hypothetical protein
MADRRYERAPALLSWAPVAVVACLLGAALTLWATFGTQESVPDDDDAHVGVADDLDQ